MTVGLLGSDVDPLFKFQDELYPEETLEELEDKISGLPAPNLPDFKPGEVFFHYLEALLRANGQDVEARQPPARVSAPERHQRRYVLISISHP